ncbi:MAG: NADH-quinone oxidoreductase subunit D [Bacillota bacterium]|jgi:NADH-quinone oxidoreductase subunit D
MAISNQESGFRTQEFVLNMGPQHPSTHGVYRAILTMDGEYVVDVENVVGYLHRGMEKIAENKTYTQFIPYTDRMDYLAGILNNWGFVMTVEKAMGIEVPERAEYIRVITGELQRIASHLVMVASMALDLNGYTPWMYAFYDREKILDLFEMICGSRLTTSFMRVGGVPNDIPEGFIPKLEKFLAELPGRADDFDNVITGNEIFVGRTKGVGVLDGNTALDFGLTGPNLRASGVNFDLRKAQPYSIYDRFDFEVPVGKNGDSFDRYNMRMLEIRQSARIIRQALDTIPEGDIMAKVPKVLKIPKGETYCHIEGSKGLLGFYLVSDGGTKPYRLHLHSPSFVNLGAYPKMAKGTVLQDAIASLASIDIVLGEVDR